MRPVIQRAQLTREQWLECLVRGIFVDPRKMLDIHANPLEMTELAQNEAAAGSGLEFYEDFAGEGESGEDSPSALLQRRAEVSRLGASEMRAAAGRIDAGDTRVVVTSFDALPDRIKKEAAKLGASAGEIRAEYDRDTVYLVEDRFESETYAEEALFHELYHKWIAGHWANLKWY